jgi:hypothetical protein
MAHACFFTHRTDNKISCFSSDVFCIFFSTSDNRRNVELAPDLHTCHMHMPPWTSANGPWASA